MMSTKVIDKLDYAECVARCARPDFGRGTLLAPNTTLRRQALPIYCVGDTYELRLYGLLLLRFWPDGNVWYENVPQQQRTRTTLARLNTYGPAAVTMRGGLWYADGKLYGDGFPYRHDGPEPAAMTGDVLGLLDALDTGRTDRPSNLAALADALQEADAPLAFCRRAAEGEPFALATLRRMEAVCRGRSLFTFSR